MAQLPNKIIIEGFWRVGKTELAAALAHKYGHALLSEPDHLVAGEIADVQQWYLKRHHENQNNFFASQSEKIICERSILSLAAYHYGLGEAKKSAEALKEFTGYYRANKPLVVFLYTDQEKIPSLASNLNNKKMSALLSDKKFCEKYENFFREVLPFDYDVVPLMIKINKAEERLTVEEVVGFVEGACSHNRLAQVNVICYKKAGPKYLVLKRNEKKGGFWQAVTGGVKLNQTPSEAITAELKEELGLQVEVKWLLPSNFSFHYIGSEGYELNEYVFGYEMKDGEILTLSDEHVEFKFLAINEALSLLKYESNKEAFQTIDGLITNQGRLK